MVSTFYVLGQVFTLISYLIFWISRFVKNKKNILFWDNISRVFAVIAFIFLGTFDGIKNTLYVIVRNIFGQFTNDKEKKFKFLFFILLLVVLFFMYFFDFNGLSTLCVAICGVLNLYGAIMCNEQGLRIFGMLGSAFYAAFLFFTGNAIGTICEIICFVVMLISYLKFRNINPNSKSKKKASN